MRTLASLAFTLFATTTLAASPEMGGGYGAIDATRDVDPVMLAERFCDIRVTAATCRLSTPGSPPS